MLYVIYQGNKAELTYRGGQDPVVHLEADLHAVIEWAEANGTRWAFSLSNAGARYTEFRSRRSELDQLDWAAIAAADFRASDVKEHKQAEFLMYERFPFDLVQRIGVRSQALKARAFNCVTGAGYQPPIEVRPEWYF